MKQFIQNTLQSFGIQIKRYPETDFKRRLQIMEHLKIDTLLDVGANIGYYALDVRKLGYKNKIISFEPLSNAYKQLEKYAEKDNNWLTYNLALGNEDKSDIINVSKNSVSSSLLNILDVHTENAPESKYTETQDIEIKKLDTIFNEICKTSKRIMLKIDTQGYEKNVIDGAINSLKNIAVLQLEMSIVPLYENELLFTEMIEYLKNKGFELFSLENGFASPTSGQLLQVDGIFVNKNVL